NLDVERITVHEELSPMFTILRIISFPAVAFISFALKSIERHQSKNTYSDQSRNQMCSHEAPDVIAIEPITINNFNQNLSQSAFHLTENNHYSLNESSMLLPQVSQLSDLCL
ncbi:hypothetical protein N9025_02885, partial [Synechococcus sp. AH-707-B22]|nr:hypothetical protein [Synechococcus sp. AH-707-B22]